MQRGSRRNRILRLWCFLLLLISGRSEAASTDSISSLLQKLKSNSRVERALAVRKLTELGEDAIPQVKEFETTHPELKFQLRTILKEIQANAANQVLEGTQIRFTTPDPITLQAAVNLIREQSKVDVEVDSDVSTLEMTGLSKSMSFWQTIDEISRAGDIGWTRTFSEIRFHPDAFIKHGATDYPKCLRVAAIHIPSKNTFRGRNQKRLTKVGFRIDVEPTIQPYFLKVYEADFQLKLQDQATLNSLTPDAKRLIEPGGKPWFEFSMNFLNENDIELEQGTVSGRVDLFCAAKQTLIEHRLLSTKQSGPLEIKKIRVDADELLVDIEILMNEGIKQLDSYQLALLHQSAWLQTGDSKNGKKVFPKNQELTQIDGLRHTIRMTFPLPERGLQQAEIHYVYPDNFALRPMKFNIKAIPFR